MRVNERTVVTRKVVLVPYCDYHVERYHGWMLDEALRHATASEALSLDEEYAMQRSWRNDADKLTFIICAPSSSPSPPAPPSAQAGQMIGDVNLFVERDDAAGLVGEVEIMIANQRFRGSGYGKAALQAFLCARIAWLRAKIGAANIGCIRLFEQVGFRRTSEAANFFGELELRWTIPAVPDAAVSLDPGDQPSMAVFRTDESTIAQ